jgi:DNA ligase-1
MRELILDGEAIALRPDGRPHPFQVTMRRFGRKLDVEALRASCRSPCSSSTACCATGRRLIDRVRARGAALEQSLPAMR